MKIVLMACHAPNAMALGRDCKEVTPLDAHSEGMLGQCIAKRWRERGHEVCNYPDPKYAAANISEYFDAVFLYHLKHAHEWDAVAPDWPYGRKPSVCWLHSSPPDEHPWGPTENIVRRFDYLPALHPIIKEDFSARKPHGHLFVLPWPNNSAWEWPPSRPNPYSGKKPAVIYCGRVRPYSLHVFGEIARQMPEIEMHVISGNIYDPGVYDEPLHPDLVHVAKVPPGVIYHPRMPNCTFSEFYWYADVGIDIRQGVEQRCASTKLIEYVAAGLPVVVDGYAPGMEFAYDMGRLKAAEFGNTHQLVELIRETLAAGRQETLRHFSREYIRKYRSSDGVADAIATLFENYRFART